MNVALSKAPDVGSAPGKNAEGHHSPGIVIALSPSCMERAPSTHAAREMLRDLRRG